MPNRLKPYLVIVLLLWPALTVLIASVQSVSPQNYTGPSPGMKKASVSATEVSTQTKGSSTTYWAKYEGTSEFGIVAGKGRISKADYDALVEHRRQVIEVYVAPGGLSWTTATPFGQFDPSDVEGRWIQSVFVGLVLSLMFYFGLAMIKFGSPRRSLNERWRANADSPSKQ